MDNDITIPQLVEPHHYADIIPNCSKCGSVGVLVLLVDHKCPACERVEWSD